jgi:hypothetical protein
MMRLSGSLLCIVCLHSAGVGAYQIPSSMARQHQRLVAVTEDSFVVPNVVFQAEDGTTTTKVTPLPPVIQQIADERAEFQINLGRAMDTLRRDMPNILSHPPGTLPTQIHHLSIARYG